MPGRRTDVSDAAWLAQLGAHGKVERIDGSGGDGGRDVQLRHPTRTDFYELKSFTGRVSKEKGRRKQVERSLASAARHKPASWTLVVPIDHTDGELKWFDTLRTKYDFPLTWAGLQSGTTPLEAGL
jgi:hypothetical protein